MFNVGRLVSKFNSVPLSPTESVGLFATAAFAGFRINHGLGHGLLRIDLVTAVCRAQTSLELKALGLLVHPIFSVCVSAYPGCRSQLYSISRTKPSQYNARRRIRRQTSFAFRDVSVEIGRQRVSFGRIPLEYRAS
jgi:hypothetical protein